MSKVLKRLIVLLLCMALVMGDNAISVFAEEVQETQEAEVETQETIAESETTSEPIVVESIEESSFETETASETEAATDVLEESELALEDVIYTDEEINDLLYEPEYEMDEVELQFLSQSEAAKNSIYNKIVNAPYTYTVRDFLGKYFTAKLTAKSSSGSTNTVVPYPAGMSTCYAYANEMFYYLFGCNYSNKHDRFTGGITILKGAELVKRLNRKNYSSESDYKRAVQQLMDSAVSGDVVAATNGTSFHYMIFMSAADTNGDGLVDVYYTAEGNYDGKSHIIINNKRNIDYLVKTKNVSMSLIHAKNYPVQKITEAPSITSVTIQNVSSAAGTYQVVANFTAEAGVSRVQFPTWSVTNGNDDLASNWSTSSTYSGTVKSLGGNAYQATYTVKKSIFGNEDDYYTTKVYVYDNEGRVVSKDCGKADLRVAPVITSVSVQDINLTYGTYTVRVKIDNFLDVERVQFLAWTAKGGQDDIATNWQTNPSISGSNYRRISEWEYTVNCSDHNNERGDYYTNIYVYGKNGTCTIYKMSSINLDTQRSGKWGDNINWSISNDGTLAIVGTGEIQSDSTEMSSKAWHSEYPWMASEEYIKRVSISEGITVIPDGCFCSLKNLETVELPSSLKSIGLFAFAECSALSGKLVLPANIEFVWGGAFYNTNISKVEFTSDNIINSQRKSFGYFKQYGFYNATGGYAQVSQTVTTPSGPDPILIEFVYNRLPFLSYKYEVTVTGTAHSQITIIKAERAPSFPSNALIQYPSSWEDTENWSVFYDAEKDTILGYNYECIDVLSGMPSGVGIEIPTKLKLSSNELQLDKNRNASLKASVYPEDVIGQIKWECDDEAVVRVIENSSDGNGTVALEALASGIAYITASIDGYEHISDTCKVVVKAEEETPISVTLVTKNLFIEAGDTRDLSYIISTSDVDITFMSSNPKVAIVDKSGHIIACSPGETTVTLKYLSNGNEITQECEVTVGAIVEAIVLSESDVNLAPNDSIQIIGSVLPKSSFDTSLVWTSENTDIATVDEYGRITAVAQGQTNIVCKSADDHSSATASVTVNVEIPEDVKDSVQKLKLSVGSDDVSDVTDGIWITGMEDKKYTGSKITQDIKVYNEYTELVEKKDYTITYKNNINAANASDLKAPQLVLNMRGNYKGQQLINFSINEVNLSTDSGVQKSDVYLAYKPNKSQYGNPVITYNGKTLKVGKDYELSYPVRTTGAYINPGKYSITVTGINNFTGSITVTEEISDKKLLSSATVKVKKTTVSYTGEAIIPEISVSYKGIQGNLIEGVDYEIQYLDDHTSIGKHMVRILALDDGMFCGYKDIAFNISGNNIARAQVQIEDSSLYFDGKAQLPVTRVYYNGTLLKANVDYSIDYLNNTNAGRGTVVITGKGNYYGSAKKAFNIKACSISNARLTIEELGTLPYSKNGVTPDVVIKDGETILQKGKDYTLSYVKNKALNDSNLAVVNITGKGNYTGKTSKSFSIEKQSIANLTISVDDKIYVAKKDKYQNKPVITDINGQKLKEKTDYTLSYEVFETESDGIPRVGSYVRVVASGCGMYKDKIAADYCIMEKSNNIVSTTVKINPVEYSGKDVYLSADDITVTLGKGEDLFELVYGVDYDIVSYTNNSKCGTATVIIKGKGVFAGQKKVTFRITQRTMSSWFRGVF